MLSARDYIAKGRKGLRKLRGLGNNPTPHAPHDPTPQEEPDDPAPEHPASVKPTPAPLNDNDPKEVPPWPPI